MIETVTRVDLSRKSLSSLADDMVAGRASHEEMAATLSSLAAKGETTEQLRVFAEAFATASIKVQTKHLDGHRPMRDRRGFVPHIQCLDHLGVRGGRMRRPSCEAREPVEQRCMRQRGPAHRPGRENGNRPGIGREDAG